MSSPKKKRYTDVKVWIPVEVSLTRTGKPEAFVHERDTGHHEPSATERRETAACLGGAPTHLVWVCAKVPVPQGQPDVKGEVAYTDEAR